MAKTKRYAALLRGVSPMNLKMADLKHALEEAGFQDVRTVLSSGNALFTASGTESSIARRAERALEATLGKSFMTIVRSVDTLRQIVDKDPYTRFEPPAEAKRVVTFLGDQPRGRVTLPDEVDGARIIFAKGGEIYTYYVPSPRGPVFMTLIEKTFGKDVTTRTWDTVKKLAADLQPSAAKRR
jgi:uncharacterized protein (DUF1697 family)